MKRFHSIPIGVTVVLLTSIAAFAEQEQAELNLERLAAPQQVVEVALENLPRTLSQKQAWKRRIRLSALMPRLSVGYGQQEANFDRYILGDITERRSESYSDSSLTDSLEQDTSESSTFTTRDISRDDYATGTDNDTVSITRIGDAPVRSYQESRSSTNPTTDQSTTTGRDTTRSGRNGSGRTTLDRSTDRSGRRTTQLTRGPEDFALTDGTRWLEDYSVRLYWDLSELLFHNDELEVVRNDIATTEFKMEFTEKVLNLYYDLKESLVYEAEGDVTVKNQMQKEFSLQMLDSLTGGFVSRYGRTSAADRPARR